MWKVSQKSVYALRAALDIARHATATRPARAAEIARRARVPPKYLEGILVNLRKAGLLGARRGRAGGHWLARDPGRIAVGNLLRAADGPLVAGVAEGRGGDDVNRALRALFADVGRDLAAAVDGITLDDLARRLAVKALDYAI